MIDSKWIESIPIVREHACQLRKLAKEVVSSRSGPYGANDYLGAMTDAFMHAQIAHIKSICILVDASQTPDALIIARSAYESMALLFWAAYGPPGKNRARQWFLYEIRERYCNWIKGEYKDLNLDPRAEISITQNVGDYADILLTEKGKRKLFQRKTLADQDFIINRLPPFRNMLEDKLLDGKIDRRAYTLYKLLSKWPHGDPHGMGMVFQHNGKCLLIDDLTCKYLGGCAIHLGIISLGKTTVLFNNHFKLDYQERITDLGKLYSEIFPSTGRP